MVSVKRLRHEKGTAVAVMALAMMFSVLITSAGIVFMAHGRFAYSSKVTSETIAAHGKELLSVKVERNPENTVLTVVNQGSVPSMVLVVLRRGADNSLASARVEPIGVGILENQEIIVLEPIEGDTWVGILTGFGNAFWEVR